MSEFYSGLDDSMRSTLLEKVDTLIKLVSYLNGVYNIEIEYEFALLSLNFLDKGDFNNLYFLDTMMDLLSNKLNRKCS